MKYPFLLLLLLLTSTAFTQEFENDYSWQAEPEWQALSKEDAQENAIFLKDHRSVQYLFDDNERLFEYDTQHKIIRVNTDQAIEQYNKVFIPLPQGDEVLDIKARTVSEKGVLKELDQSNIKEVSESSEIGSYKIFAVEGVETNVNIEYVYTVKRTAKYFGRHTFQKEVPVKNASFEIISPEHIVYIAQGYNGFPEMKVNISDGFRILSGSIDRIGGLQDERYAAPAANAMRVDYKISHNTKLAQREMFTWTDAAQRVHEVIYGASDRELKQAKKALGEIELKGLSEEEKIRSIENHIKKNYHLREYGPPEATNLEYIVKNKVTDEIGFVRLFAAMLNHAHLVHDLVMTSTKSQHRFDKEFMNWNYLENYLFYFPGIKAFMAPSLIEYRLGLFPYEWANNDGLFIREVSLGDSKTAFGQVKNIPELHMDDHFDNLEMKVKFDHKMEQCEIGVKRSFGGQNAMVLRPFYDLIPETQDKENIMEELLQFVGSDAEVLSKKLTNTDRDTPPFELPLILEGQLNLRSGLERAGKDYLFKVGLLIGTQVEMYQEKLRQNPVEIEYPHKYLREINIEIPEGYSVKGLEELNINLEYGDKEGNTMGFLSGYTQEGSTIQIQVYEYYLHTNYPLTQFNEFREVINAAADFNKVVLVFEKI